MEKISGPKEQGGAILRYEIKMCVIDILADYLRQFNDDLSLISLFCPFVTTTRLMIFDAIRLAGGFRRVEGSSGNFHSWLISRNSRHSLHTKPCAANMGNWSCILIQTPSYVHSLGPSLVHSTFGIYTAMEVEGSTNELLGPNNLIKINFKR